MKRFAALSLIVCLLLGLTACTMGQPKDAVSAAELIASPDYPAGIALDDSSARMTNLKNNPVSEESKKAINLFSYTTAASILQTVATNGCYSPLSLYYSLAMAGTGANGKTRDELFALLGTSDPAQLSQQIGNLYRLLYTDTKITQLKIANSLWLDNEYNGSRFQLFINTVSIG